MPIIGFASKTGADAAPVDEAIHAHAGNPDDPLDVVVPASNAQTIGAEEHTLEIAPINANGLTISLALKIKPGQGGANSATPFLSAAARAEFERIQGRGMADQMGKPQYGGYRARVAEIFLADLDLFLSRNPQWGEITLQKAGGNDHRIIFRIRDGQSFRVDTLDQLAETMNKAERGEISPDAFRNNRTNRERAEGDGGNPSNPRGASNGRKNSG